MIIPTAQPKHRNNFAFAVHATQGFFDVPTRYKSLQATLPPINNMGRAEYIDLAHWEESFHYDEAQRPIDGAIMKLTEGTTWTDPSIPSIWPDGVAKCKVRGAYHYQRSGLSWLGQVNHFIDVINRTEDSNGVGFNIVVIDGEKINNAVDKTFIYDSRRMIEQLQLVYPSKRVMLYTNKDMLQNYYYYIGALVYGQEFVNWLDSIDLWYAQYYIPRAVNTNPSMAKQRDPNNWRGWQWSEAGVPSEWGTGGYVDLNVYNGSPEEFTEWATGIAPTPPPENTELFEAEFIQDHITVFTDTKLSPLSLGVIMAGQKVVGEAVAKEDYDWIVEELGACYPIRVHGFTDQKDKYAILRPFNPPAPTPPTPDAKKWRCTVLISDSVYTYPDRDYVTEFKTVVGESFTGQYWIDIENGILWALANDGIYAGKWLRIRTPVSNATTLWIRLTEDVSPAPSVKSWVVAKWGSPQMTPFGYDLSNMTISSNFGLCCVFIRDDTGFGHADQVAMSLEIPHGDIMRLAAMQTPDDFTVNDKMRWLMHSDHGRPYWFGDPDLDNWAVDSPAYWGPMVYSGQLVAQDGDIVSIKGNYRSVRGTFDCIKLVGFTPADWGKTHDQYPYILQHATAFRKTDTNPNTYNDSPKGKIVAPFYDVSNPAWTFRGLGGGFRPDGAYLPVDVLIEA